MCLQIIVGYRFYFMNKRPYPFFFFIVMGQRLWILFFNSLLFYHLIEPSSIGGSAIGLFFLETSV